MRDLFRKLFQTVTDRQRVLASAYVLPETGRCVQCGICSFNCPLGIDVRGHARSGKPIKESRCITCGECICRCPRGVLYFEDTVKLPRDRQEC
jgi:heterodisulfide reductase subunit C